jgi:hypothetical protein
MSFMYVMLSVTLRRGVNLLTNFGEIIQGIQGKFNQIVALAR